MEIKEIQNRLKEGNGMVSFSVDELKYVRKPIGKQIYKSIVEEVKEEKPKPRWDDKVKCKVCGSVTLRSNQSTHKKSQKHKLYEGINEKIRNVLLE